ncbi:hypothetical protein ES332_A05G172300v1 [Gossypium tomentosum]|uniref:Uncharacterized protein n=1 Tax=Gossypium tomentosum TaxID=34277 RepID=A0A5D2QIX9_GOSTO|nr:hypothetical protein ES332_A05G172300v1 [Gossypium tomentosum]
MSLLITECTLFSVEQSLTPIYMSLPQYRSSTACLCFAFAPEQDSLLSCLPCLTIPSTLSYKTTPCPSNSYLPT